MVHADAAVRSLPTVVPRKVSESAVSTVLRRSVSKYIFYWIQIFEYAIVACTQILHIRVRDMQRRRRVRAAAANQG